MKKLILIMCTAFLLANCSNDLTSNEENENNGDYFLELITNTCSGIFDENVSVVINGDEIFIDSENEDFQDFEGTKDDGDYLISVSFDDADYVCDVNFAGFMGITCETDNFICYVNYFKNEE